MILNLTRWAFKKKTKNCVYTLVLLLGVTDLSQMLNWSHWPWKQTDSCSHHPSSCSCVAVLVLFAAAAAVGVWQTACWCNLWRRRSWRRTERRGVSLVQDSWLESEERTAFTCRTAAVSCTFSEGPHMEWSILVDGFSLFCITGKEICCNTVSKTIEV